MTQEVNAEPMMFGEDLDGVKVLHAPAVTDFTPELLSAGERVGSIAVVGRDIVIYATNGDFHYRTCDEQPDPRYIRMRRVDE